MCRKKIVLFIISTVILFSGLRCSDPVSSDETVSSVVSTDWLSSNIDNGTYAVIDVRSAEEFSNGHIPKSINLPFDIMSVWAHSDFDSNGLWLELPEISTLTSQLGTNGISYNSNVILVTSLPSDSNPYSLAAPTRVALTLTYAGLKNISILDGGFDKWFSEGLPVSTEATAVTPVAYNFDGITDLFVEMNHVKNGQGSVILVDARDTEVYNGSVMEPFADKPGHIPTAVSLPAPSLWNSDGTYKTETELRALAEQAVGIGKDKETVIYCGVGGYASTVWFALTKILDYTNVKVYDGSAQEWVMTNEMEM